MSLLRFFIVLTLSMNVTLALSQGSDIFVLRSDIEKSFSLREFCKVYPDSMGILGVEEIMSGKHDHHRLKDLTSLDENIIYWVTFSIRNTHDMDVRPILTLAENNFASLYILADSLMGPYLSGELVPSTQKELSAGRKKCVFPITAYANSTTSFYLRIHNKTHFPPVLEPVLHNKEEWLEGQRLENIFQAFFQGILFLLFIYSLSIFAMYPQRVYAFFALFVLSISTYFLWFKGLLHEFILPNYPNISIYIWLIGGLIPVFYIQFARQFINTAELLPRWDKFLNWLVRIGYGIFVIAVILFVITFDRPLVVIIANNYILFTLLTGLVFIYALYRTKSKLALFFILGSLIFALCSITGVILYQYFNYQQAIYFIQAGNIAELLCFSVGLGYRINLLQKKKIETDRRLIEELQKNEALQKQINRELGIAIDDRDQQLEQKNEELTRLVETLQSVNADLSTFAYSISHDLKTPLRAISSMATFIEQDQGEKLEPKAKEYLGILQDRVRKMESLFNGILEYSRLSTSDQKMSVVDLNSTIRSVMDVIELPDHIQLTVQKDLPRVNAYPTRIHQVFQNLIVNAVKFMDKKEGAIEIGYSDESECWKFFVRDNGCGIDPGSQERIFLIFKTTGSTTRHGTGVGLSIVKKAIEQHGGKVWVESEPGQGATFYFTLLK